MLYHPKLKLWIPFAGGVKTDIATGKTVTALGDYATNAVGTGVAGLCSRRFDGTGDGLSLADGADWALGTGDFTIAFWVKHSSFSSYNTYCVQIASGTNATNYVTNDGSSLMMYDYNSGYVMKCACSHTPSAGVWYHYAFSRISGVIKIYVDSVSKTLTTNTSPSASLRDVAAAFVIGADIYDNAYYLNGWMADFQFYKGFGASDGDIKRIYLGLHPIGA